MLIDADEYQELTVIDGYTDWWLRNRGIYKGVCNENEIALVESDGVVNAEGDYSGELCGVRPALWLKLKK
jgi:hypothetical protein